MAAAYYINVAEWTAENVAEWLGGLDDAIFPYAHFFINNQIDGRHLLTLLPDDLKNLNITKIGHQEIILDAVDLLRQLHYTLTTETLQSISLRVGCKARSLYNDLKRNGPKNVAENVKQERISVSILSAVSDILIAVKAFISWLDRYPFEGEKRYAPIRKTVLKLSIELASTAQRDQFAEKPHDVIKASVLNLAELCDRVIQEFNDSLIIQPVSLDIVTVKRKADEEWGLHIDSSYNGVLVVGNVKYQSPAHRSGKVEIGDEIIQVNYQTVVGWQLKKLVYSMSEHSTEVHLCLKKRPRHASLLGQLTLLKPYRIPSRKVALARHQKWSDSQCSLHIQEGYPTILRAPIANSEVDEEDDSAFLPDPSNSPSALLTPSMLSANGSVVGSNGSNGVVPTPYQILPSKSRITVQRRATVSGSSPTVARPPVHIEDLVVKPDGATQLQKELVSRSISHDPSKNVSKNGLEIRFLSTLKTIRAGEEIVEDETKAKLNGNEKTSSFSTSKQQRQLKSSAEVGSQISSGMSASGSDADSGIMDEKSWNPVKTALQTFEEEYTDMERKSLTPEDRLRKMVDLISSPSTLPPPAQPPAHSQISSPSSFYSLDRISDRKHSNSSNLSNESYKKDLSSISAILEDEQNQKLKIKIANQQKNCSLAPPLHEKKAVKIFQTNSPLLRRKNHGKYASRRVSCKDLGQGDCQGYLHKRKDGRRLFSGPKWTKRWVILKKQYLYCYHDKDDVRAECLLFLPGFTVSPASECKAKKYAFKLHSQNASFLFASDTLSDMTKWMNKMGLAAISYTSLGIEKEDLQDVYFSETEDENEDQIPSLPSSLIGTWKQSLNSSPDKLTSCETLNSSSTFQSPSHHRSSSDKLNTTHLTPLNTQKGTSSFSPNNSTSRSGSSTSIHSGGGGGVIKSETIKNQQLSSPKQPLNSAALKFTYPKLSGLNSSPKKTVAEKPLEKTCPETQNRYSGNWSSSSEGNSCNFGDVSSTTVTTSPLSFYSYDSVNPGLTASPQSPVVHPQSIARSNIVLKEIRPTVQQLHPNRASYASQASQGLSKSNLRFNQSASASTILRCSSLQKLNNVSSSTTTKDDVSTEDVIEDSKGLNSQQTEFVSMLDREYRKLYGSKKKPEMISQSQLTSAGEESSSYAQSEKNNSASAWWNGNNSNSMVRSATSRQIHSLYTRRDSWKVAGEVEENAASGATGKEHRERNEKTTDKDGSPITTAYSPQTEKQPQFFLTGVNSIDRTAYKKEASANKTGNFFSNFGAPTESSGGGPSTSKSSSVSSIQSSENVPKTSKFSLSKQFSPKSPGNATFRFFSSPKFVRKFTSPKLERKQMPMMTSSSSNTTVPSSTQTTPCGYNNTRTFLSSKTSNRKLENSETRLKVSLPSSPPPPPPPPPPLGPKPQQKTERTFLGSPKLARAFFGSPKQQQVRKAVNTATTAVQTEHTFDELVRLHQKTAQFCNPSNFVEKEQGVVDSEDKTTITRSQSNSSLNSNASGSLLSSTGSSLFYVETRIRPQITISLPLVTETSSKVNTAEDRPETPETPRTPGGVKPTMGVSMLSKKRSPSANGDFIEKDRRTTTTIEGGGEEEVQDEEETIRYYTNKEDEVKSNTKRSEIRVVINGEECIAESGSNIVNDSSSMDDVETLLNSFRSLGLTPDGVHLEERRRKTMLNPCQDDRQINRMILDLRALQRTLRDHQLEATAIEELFSVPVTSETLQDWICRYNDLLPPDYC